jgi:predicted ATPase/DNA-binding winged helix-turn-helix (wHTH) protein
VAVETTSNEAPPAIEFGPFRYDPVRWEITDSRGPLRVGSRALRILGVLLEHPGRLYSRDELVARVWPSTVVEETSLRVHVSALRKVLGDGLDGARYITNVPGRGYAFVGEVRTATPSRAATRTMPAPSAASAHPLPPRLTRPIGREQVIAQIGQLLARERLVTIVGAGGMGKTTVALAVADGLRAEYADGACLVDLSRLSDPSLVAVELGQTQGLIVSPGDPATMLEAALRDKHLLFVVDNCEHVIDAVASLVNRLMRMCPGVHFLATSRESLEIEAEWVFKLPPLALPHPDDQVDLEDLLAYPAIQLFVERARAICDSFELTEAHASTVRQLCGFLDGIPLAIELAAARVDSLGVHGLLRRLENAFELLTRGRRTALSRHRTLQAVLDWSHDLLSDSEKLVLQRLSVFRGAFDLDGAVTVASCGQMSRQRVIEDVLSLCAKSLVVLDSGDDDLLLHRLLYITRLYAEKRLATAADAPEVHRRHARFVLEGLLRARQAGEGLSQYKWSPALYSSIADVRAAIEWTLLEENDLALGVQLTAYAKRIYSDIGLVDEYLGHNEHALSKLARTGGELEHLELPLHVASCTMRGYLVEGQQQSAARFSRTRQLLVSLGSDEDRIEALFGMSTTSYGYGNYRLSLGICEEIRGLAQGKFEPLAIAISDRVSALNLHALGEHDAAEPLAWRVIAFNGARVGRQFLSEVPFGVSMRIQLARIHWLRGNFDTAWRFLVHALEGSMDAHVFARCQVLGTAAVPMAIWRGDMALADQWTKDLRDISERKGLPYWQAFARAFRCVLDGEAIPPGSSVELTMQQCAPLGELVAAIRAASPSAQVRARVEEGAVGWCAPEVMRLMAADEFSHAPAAAKARLEQAMQIARKQGARFWMLRIAITMVTMAATASEAEVGMSALATVRDLLSCIDDGSSIPDLVAARALLENCT